MLCGYESATDLPKVGRSKEIAESLFFPIYLGDIKKKKANKLYSPKTLLLPLAS